MRGECRNQPSGTQVYTHRRTRLGHVAGMNARMLAQDLLACLDWAVAAIGDRPGAIVELGLGNGRTYDHLRQCWYGNHPGPSCLGYWP